MLTRTLLLCLAVQCYASSVWADEAAKKADALDLSQIIATMSGGAPPAAADAQKEYPDFEDVTKDMEQHKGLFTLWFYPEGAKDKDTEKLLCQIPSGSLGEKFMLSTSFSGGGFFTGFPLDERVVKWEEHGRQLLLIEPETSFVTDVDHDVKDVVRRTYPDRIRKAVPIVTKSPSGDPVIDLGGLLKSNFADIGWMSFGRGEISILLGCSGAGKSTLLRLVAGLSRPDRGSVQVAGEEVTQLRERELFRVRERIGMLFQGGALLDSMTVFDNVALPLRERTRLAEADITAEVHRRLDAVGLPGTEGLFPRHLSGGMLRRAALARAIITDPEIVLCDEPFSGLDPVNVRRIEGLLTELSRELGLTLVVTSHHIPSSLRMADRIVFLVDGAAVSGTPDELRASRDKRVINFLEAERDALDEDAPFTSAGSGALA